jgi:hypothetical protein
MSIQTHSKRGRTFRDDFDSYRPWWRTVTEIVAAVAEPVTRPLARILRERSRRPPPLDNRMRRDIGLPPLPEPRHHDRWR